MATTRNRKKFTSFEEKREYIITHHVKLLCSALEDLKGKGTKGQGSKKYSFDFESTPEMRDAMKKEILQKLEDAFMVMSQPVPTYTKTSVDRSMMMFKKKNEEANPEDIAKKLEALLEIARKKGVQIPLFSAPSPDPAEPQEPVNPAPKGKGKKAPF